MIDDSIFHLLMMYNIIVMCRFEPTTFAHSKKKTVSNLSFSLDSYNSLHIESISRLLYAVYDTSNPNSKTSYRVVRSPISFAKFNEVTKAETSTIYTRHKSSSISRILIPLSASQFLNNIILQILFYFS